MINCNGNYLKSIYIKHNIVTQLCCCSVTKSCPTLRPHGLQHARLAGPSPFPRACLISCPLSWWWHPTISSSVNPFASCSQSFPESESFPTNHLFTLGGQSIGVSALASILPMYVQGWFPLGLTGLISLLSKGLSKSSLAPQFESIEFSPKI